MVKTMAEDGWIQGEGKSWAEVGGVPKARQGITLNVHDPIGSSDISVLLSLHKMIHQAMVMPAELLDTSPEDA